MEEKQQSNPLLTVVCAIYNTEEYFERCLKSIMNSDYQNMEILLVDDGSTDNCPRLCEEYAAMDSRIRVVHKKNEGCHSSYNTGISLANGKYVVIIDNDDYVPLDAYSKLVKKIEETNADIVHGTVRRTFADGGDVQLWTRRKDDSLLTRLIGFHGVIYRTDLLRNNHIEFIPYCLGDDNGFMLQVLHYASHVQYMEDVTYEYVMRSQFAKNASLMQRRDFNNYYDDFRWRRWSLEYICKYEDLKKQAYGNMSEFCMAIDERWLRFSKEEREACFEELKIMADLVDWEHDVRKSVGYLQVPNEKLQKMTEAQYTRHLKLQFKVKNPLKKILGRKDSSLSLRRH
jgi:glycosyltransferase involved in cell wall biosynthesis